MTLTLNQNRASKTTKLSSTDIALENRLGFRAYALGNKARALQHFRQATVLNPNCLESQRWLGRIALELGLGAEAQSALETVIRLQGQSLAIMELLEFARNINRYGFQAAHLYREGCQKNQSNDNKISCFEAAVIANPDHQPAWASLGNVLLETRDYEGAINACLEAVFLDPNDKGSGHRLSKALRISRSSIPRIHADRAGVFTDTNSVFNISIG